MSKGCAHLPVPRVFCRVLCCCGQGSSPHPSEGCSEACAAHAGQHSTIGQPRCPTHGLIHSLENPLEITTPSILRLSLASLGLAEAWGSLCLFHLIFVSNNIRVRFFSHLTLYITPACLTPPAPGMVPRALQGFP